ncbi:MAG: hypothetical protein LBU32_25600 [Clostridiales bacterium]|jgi:DNA excision repair protein ERCC-3|nr:hypothetical protein [Clostridiales bacterium]
MLEKTGFIATVSCTEVRVPLDGEDSRMFAIADKRKKFRIAAENSKELDFLETLLEIYKYGRILIIGTYIGQLSQ